MVYVCGIQGGPVCPPDSIICPDSIHPEECIHPEKKTLMFSKNIKVFFPNTIVFS